MVDSDRLDGQVALVTGGSRGIGRSVALALALRGADVAVVAQTRAAAEPTAERIRAMGLRSMALGADVASWPAVEVFVQQVVSELGPPHVLVNNAGISGMPGAIAELSPESFERTLAVNVLGPLHGMRAVLPLMIERQSGVVINMSSGASQRPRPTRSMYGTTKVALDFLSVVASAEVAASGIRVYTIHPGVIDTDMHANDVVRSPEMQHPDEVGACIAWLATASGAAWTQVVVPWREPPVRERIRQMPGFLKLNLKLKAESVTGDPVA